MNSLSLNFENRGLIVMQYMRDFYVDTTEILRLYFNKVSAEIPSGAADNDVIASNRLTKKNIVDAVILAEQIKHFLLNDAAPASAEYLINIDAILSADQQGQFVSKSIDDLAEKVVNFVSKVKQAYIECLFLAELYTKSILEAAVEAINDVGPGKEVLGCNLDASVFIGGYNLFSDFKKLLTNTSVAQADRLQIVIDWKVF